MYILYNILILIVLVIFIVPYYTYRLFTEKASPCALSRA